MRMRMRMLTFEKNKSVIKMVSKKNKKTERDTHTRRSACGRGGELRTEQRVNEKLRVLWSKLSSTGRRGADWVVVSIYQSIARAQSSC